MTERPQGRLTAIGRWRLNRPPFAGRVAGGAVVLMISVALQGCRPVVVTDTPAPGSVQDAPAPSASSPPASTEPAVAVTAPDRLLGFDLVTEQLADDEDIPGLYDAPIEARIADQLGLAAADFPATVTSPADDAGETELHKMRLVIVRLPLDRPIDAIGAYLAEQLTRDGAVARVANTTTDENRPYSGGGAWSIGHVEGALVIIGLDPAAFSGPTDFSGTGPTEVIEAAFDAMLPEEPEPTPRPPRTPEPTASAETPPPDPDLEARLPSEMDGRLLRIVSFAHLRDVDLGGGFGTIVPSVLVPHLGVDAADASMGVAADDETSFTIWAHRIKGFSGAQLEAAMLGVLMAGPSHGAGFPFYGGEVNGRRYTANPSWALFAEEDILYWLLYFDVGDCFSECELPDRTPFLEIIEDTIAAIPSR